MSSHRDSAQQRINLTTASDQMLLELTREGFSEAFGELWRRHSCAAVGAARAFTGYDPNDLAQDAFLKVYASITNGGNLPISFRAYVATAVRNLARDMARRTPAVFVDSYSDDDRDDTITEDDFSDRVFENSTTGQAFAELPTHHRELLWYRDVEDLPVQEIARYVGMTPNSTTVAIRRARDAFKTAWIKVQLSPARNLPAECAAVVSKLPAFTRNKLSGRELAHVELHLLDCVHCAAVASEADQLHKHLAMVLLPLLFIGGAPSYLAWIQSRKNRTPAPTAAHYLDVTLSGIRHSPATRGTAVSPVARTPRTLAVAAATTALLVIGTGAVALVNASLTSDTVTSAKQSQQERDESVEREELDGLVGDGAFDDPEDTQFGHELDTSGDENPVGTLSWHPHGADAEVRVSTRIPTREPFSADGGSVPSSPGSDGGQAPGPAAPSPTAPSPTSPSPQPVQPAPEPTEPEPTEPEPEPVVYPEYRAVSVVTVPATGEIGISATPGATITIRVSAPRTVTLEVTVIADANGEAGYNFPGHRGLTVRYSVSQAYSTAEGSVLDPVWFTQANFYVPAG